MTDYDRGYKAITAYYSAMRTMYPTVARLSLLEFVNSLKKIKGGSTLIDGVGGGIREVGMSDSDVNAAMTALARNGRGKIPPSFMDFFNFLQNQAVKINYIDMIATVTVDSGSDVLSGVQSVGDSLITTGKILNFLLPAILLLFAFFWLDRQSGGKLSHLAAKGAKALK